MDSINKKSCFVIAPRDVELQRFLEALRSLNLEPFFLSDFLATGSRPLSAVRTAFRSVDLVIALLFRTGILDNVWFELGFAFGLGKRTLVLADRMFDQPVMKDIEVNYVDLSNPTTTLPIIQQWLTPKPVSESFAPMARAERIYAIRQYVPKREKLSVALESLRKAQDIANEAGGETRLESRIIDLFTEAGFTVAKAPSHRGEKFLGADLAVWIDDVPGKIGNPIAVEIKSRLNHNNARDAISRLTASMASAGAKAGILIHSGSDLQTTDFLAQNTLPIFVLSVDELAASLENDSFSKLLKSRQPPKI